MSKSLAALVLIAVPAVFPARLQAQDVTPAQVREKIDKGIHFLKSNQKNENGNWEHFAAPGGMSYPGGTTSLALLALLECGVSPDDAAVAAGLKYLRGITSDQTYCVALQTMVLARADPKRDLLKIQANTQWLKKQVQREGNQIIGWGYGPNFGGRGVDNSNSQYAMLGLHYASLAGVPVEQDFWKDLQNFYKDTQQQKGAWSYSRREGPRLTMTSAGVCGLLIAGMELYKNQEIIEKDGSVRNCGRYEDSDHLARGLRWIGDQFTIEGSQFPYYNLYGLERAGRLSGQRFFVNSGGGKHDWYRVGTKYLVRLQDNNDGSWKVQPGAILDYNNVVTTSFALLFLSKGKTAVLIHKLMHGGEARTLAGDWNNDRHDARNLTEYCSQQLFKKLPLAWQALDASRYKNGDPDSVADMLQAPILYFNGHKSPLFTGNEKHLLKEYIEHGGFILAEACCSRTEFDRGFRKLAAELWPDNPLQPLGADHPIWTAFAPVPPGSFKLEGIEFGCKTCLIYSPEDMSCHWNSNRFDGDNVRTTLAFRAGANIVAYATGLEPPLDKLTRIELANKQIDPIKRNYLHVAQVNYGGRDWQPAPNAMRNVMDHLRKEWNIDVILQTKPLTLGDPNLFNYKFLYMHGRRTFNILAGNQKLLRDHLEAGGVLLADACCGSKAFDDSFRGFIKEMFGRDLEPIKLDDPLYGERIGKSLQTVQCRTQKGTPYHPMAPQLEGVRLDPKNPKSPWIVVYSKYDLGCALEKHHSPDCLGHSHQSALEIATQVVLYALKE